jgi:hypothetical protein
MAGTLSRSKPSPVTGVVATTWNAGIWGAGAGVDGREGAGAETRREGAERAGLAAGVARRTGAGRGAVTVTSGSVSVTWAQAAFGTVNVSGNSKALTATAPNRRRLLTSSRDAALSTRPAARTAPPVLAYELPKETLQCSNGAVPLPFANSDWNIWQCDREATYTGNALLRLGYYRH